VTHLEGSTRETPLGGRPPRALGARAPPPASRPPHLERDQWGA
jgi:hypothetical protein